MSEKYLTITGANRGIGLALTMLYKKRGFHVTACCRNSSDELNECADRVVEGVSLTSTDAIETTIESLQNSPIDLLINNAGMWYDESIDAMEMPKIAEQMQTNALAPLQITTGLLPQIRSGGKIAMVSSRMGSIGDNSSGGRYGYRASKAALNAFSRSLAMDLRDRDISVAILHPGLVSTRMINFAGDLTPEQSAAGLAMRIDELNLTNSGTFWHQNGDVLPW